MVAEFVRLEMAPALTAGLVVGVAWGLWMDAKESRKPPPENPISD
jgi:hypothetical protein